jgi:hypothetical protein
MKNNDNEILIIQTSESSSIFITKDLFPFDDPDLEQICYTISEGNNPLYWLDAWHTDLQEVINLLEFPNRSVSVRRDYISWWLNCRPSFIDDSVKSTLKQRLVNYHLTGEIKNTFRNAKYGLEFNCDCLFEWHSLLSVEYDRKLLDLIPTEANLWYNEITTITILFDGFLHLPYSRISLKTNLFPTFQNFLDHIYGLIRNEVNQFSYGKEWILFNTNSGQILQKNNLNVMLPLSELTIKNADKIICYKK